MGKKRRKKILCVSDWMDGCSRRTEMETSMREWVDEGSVKFRSVIDWIEEWVWGRSKRNGWVTIGRC